MILQASCSATAPHQAESRAAAAPPQPEAIVNHYADIAHAVYSDSLTTATALQQAVNRLLANPTETTLEQAKVAWITARHPYQQSEVFRFGNPIVDEWEGKVNAWPLDEGLIDYVAIDHYGEESAENPYYRANIIANPQLTVAGKAIDATVLNSQFIATELHELEQIETNVATGYHAIEFLLWGQDLNGSGPGAGNRPATDFSHTQCTHGNCDRRGGYLKAVTDQLVDDLRWMTVQWQQKGAARTALLTNPNQGIAAMITGMGSLSFGELAGERMKLGVLLHDPEEEHDCFSDNTHWSHYNNGLGIQNVYLGRYQRLDGSVLEGPSLSSWVYSQDRAIDNAMRIKLSQTVNQLYQLVESAEKRGIAYDQLLAAGNRAGNQLILDGVTALIEQTRQLERVVAVLGLEQIAFEGSDSLK
ncbi:peptidase [Ectothiorhodospiraceae bacterium BW-2]|nr:peptidase [Ectothiorhodospiraceae bacterium BW-2]